MNKNHIYVLDTSALISDPTAWKHFPDSTCILPVVVLEELDSLKQKGNEVARNARAVIRALDEVSEQGDISTGILLEDNIFLKVDTKFYDASQPKYAGFGDPKYGDTQILICAYEYLQKQKEVTLLSNDINLRIKAKARGIAAAPHAKGDKTASDMFLGIQVLNDEEAGLLLQDNGEIDAVTYGLEDLFLNECVLFQDEEKNGIALGKKVSNNKIKLVKKNYPWGIASRNKEQAFAIDLIMDRNIDLVTLTGKAGCGKTIVALASALELVLTKKEYDRLVIYRPIQPVGNDIGYLPGTEEEKLAPWFQAIIDNFEVLFQNKSGDWKRNLEMFQKKGKIEMEAITYIRGRSIPNSIMLVDEVQNLSKEDIKTILTRAGEGTKIILSGDIEQIDNTRLDSENNGLSYVIDKFKNSAIAGHITFTQGERSRLATMAAEIL